MSKNSIAFSGGILLLHLTNFFFAFLFSIYAKSILNKKNFVVIDLQKGWNGNGKSRRRRKRRRNCVLREKLSSIQPRKYFSLSLSPSLSLSLSPSLLPLLPDFYLFFTHFKEHSKNIVSKMREDNQILTNYLSVHFSPLSLFFIFKFTKL